MTHLEACTAVDSKTEEVKGLFFAVLLLGHAHSVLCDLRSDKCHITAHSSDYKRKHFPLQIQVVVTNMTNKVTA